MTATDIPALYLIPVFLSDENANVLPESVISIIHSLDEFVVENEKTARAFLKKIKSPFPQTAFIFHELNEHSSPHSVSELSLLFKKNKPFGLMSEAGCPAVADPGSELVRQAHENNFRVVPLTGPSSMLLALMASGMNGQSYVFHGYLPRESDKRKIRLKEIERDALKKNQTQIFIETPYRNTQMMADILSTLENSTRVCIACDLTSPHEFISTKAVADWRKNNTDIQKKPTVFLIGK